MSVIQNHHYGNVKAKHRLGKEICNICIIYIQKET